jgi:hypothetical protein
LQKIAEWEFCELLNEFKPFIRSVVFRTVRAVGSTASTPRIWSRHQLRACFKCGSSNVDWLTRIIGYLKRISNFSEARRVEAAKRFYDDGRAQV